MAGVYDVRARWSPIVLCMLVMIAPVRADFKMPDIAHAKAIPRTTSQCSVCGTVTPNPNLAAAARARAKAAAQGTTPAPDHGPGPVFAQAAEQAPHGPAAPHGSFHVTTVAPPHKGPQGPFNPKNLNIPLISGLAVGGAAVAGGITWAAVAASKHHAEHPSHKFLGKAHAAAAAPTPAPLATMPHTILDVAVLKGATTIEVPSTVGFAVGDTIRIGTEYNMIKGFSSIILDHPMNTMQPRGATVQVVHQPANAKVIGAPPATAAAANAAATSVDQVLGEAGAAAPPPVASMKGAAPPVEPSTTVAPVEDNGATLKILFYAVFVGALVCCMVCGVAAVCAFCMRRNKEEYGGLSESEEEEEYSISEEETELEDLERTRYEAS